MSPTFALLFHGRSLVSLYLCRDVKPDFIGCYLCRGVKPDFIGCYLYRGVKQIAESRLVSATGAHLKFKCIRDAKRAIRKLHNHTYKGENFLNDFFHSN